MTVPLMALAVGAVLAGFVGIPAALGGSNAIEHFLEPSFTAEHVEAAAATEAGHEQEEAHASQSTELGLMAFSVVIAVIGILLAYRFYVTSPEISERLARSWPGLHRLLSNKYYVDELYNATAVAASFVGGRKLWTFDRRVVDGAVNGAGWLTIVGAWFSGLTDRTIVDGAVNLIARICEEGSFWFRKVQTGLVQNYALLMLFGIFGFVTVYLVLR